MRRRVHRAKARQSARQTRTRPAARRQALLIVHASELLTLRRQGDRPRTGETMRDLSIIYDGAVLVESGRVQAVGETSEITRRHGRAVHTIDATGKVVMPGIVDPHTHAAFVGSRHEEVAMKAEGLSYAEIAARGGGILKTVCDTRAASREVLAASTQRRLDGMLHFGTTTVEVKSGYGLTVESELSILQVINDLARAHPIGVVPTFMGAHAIPPEYEGRPDAYVGLLLHSMIPAVARSGMARFCDVWVEDGYFSADHARRILTAAKKVGMGAKLHADELSDTGGAALAADVGATSADHLVHASNDGLRAMADAGVVAVLLPGASFGSRIPYADARRIVRAGVPVALGTDCSPASWTESMQFILALAAHYLGMRPDEAITAATANAAHAIGMGTEIGTIEPGKRADLLVMDVPTYSHLGYRIASNHIETVIKAGRIVVDRTSSR